MVSQSHATLNTATLLTSLAMVVITILWSVQLQFIISDPFDLLKVAIAFKKTDSDGLPTLFIYYTYTLLQVLEVQKSLQMVSSDFQFRWSQRPLRR